MLKSNRNMKPDEKNSDELKAIRFAKSVSLATALLALVTFAIAILTPPLSGPFCEGNCFVYPYHDILSRFPRDYLWMFAALPLTVSYLVMVISVYVVYSTRRRILGLTGVAFALMSTLLLFTDYFVQVSVVQPSLLAREYDGIALLSQFNPHGLFIALEEVGFLFSIVALACIASLFGGPARLEKAIRRIALLFVILAIVAFIWLSFQYGLKREYRFEVVIISLAWFEIIVLGVLIFLHFHLSRDRAQLSLSHAQRDNSL